jgi:hypothetical protein
VYKAPGELTADGQAYAFYVGGEVVEYIDADGKAGTTADPGASFAANAVYDLTVVDGVITAATLKTAAVTAKEILAMDSTFVVLTDGGLRYFATSYTVVDKDASYALDTLSVGDDVTVYVNGDSGKIEFVVISEVVD